jgi:hypothetical protein
MKTTASTRTLHLLAVDRDERRDAPDPADRDTGDPARQRYWREVQALRADLARLRPAN